jgi:valyl-tRNA synthetase
MSKSAGNVLDPIELMDEYGTDALRFTLLTGSTPGNDMNLSVERVAANRNFANKIWNAARFLVGNLEDEIIPPGTPPLTELSLADRWILSRLHHLIETVDRLFEGYLYGEAGRQVYDFLWGEYADWYIEIAKIALYGKEAGAKARTQHILTYVLDQCLRLLHPFIPYVTEEIWQHIPHQGEALIIARWPQVDEDYFDMPAESDMNLLMELIRAIRNARAEYNVPPSRCIQAIISGGSATEMLIAQRELFGRLANVDPDTLQIETTISEPPSQATTITIGGIAAYLPLAGLVDLDAEKSRLERELEEAIQQIGRSEELLANQGFVERAPAEVIQRERDKLTRLTATQDELEKRITDLNA